MCTGWRRYGIILPCPRWQRILTSAFVLGDDVAEANWVSYDPVPMRALVWFTRAWIQDRSHCQRETNIPGLGYRFPTNLQTPAKNLVELIASCLPLFGAKFTGSRSNRNRHCFVRQLSERNSRRREILRRRFDYESRINRASKKFQFCIYTNFSNFLFTYFSLSFAFLV